MTYLWSESTSNIDTNGYSTTTGAVPDETPTQPWDTWDLRGLWNQPLPTTQASPPTTPTRYPSPWQVYPR